MNPLTQERLRYVVNGVLATLVHFAVLELCLGMIGLRSAGLANAIGAMAGIATSFAGSRMFVFVAGRDQPIPGQFARFLVLYGCIAVFHAGFLLVWTDLGGLSHRIGFLIATVFQVLGSYFGNRLWVFK
jgi:putative flippase GtrA